MKNATCRLLAPVLFVAVLAVSQTAHGQASADRAAEESIVRYLREHVKPGKPLIVSELYNNVFKTPEERKVLDRLFNIFFKIPLFVAQYKASTGGIPTLADISRQFNLPIEGEASVLLSIVDSDPRVPKFIARDPETGEITAVDVEAVKKDRRFGQLLERSLAGWQGKEAPAFILDLIGGTSVSSEDLARKNYLIYFWFSGCPPCMQIAPHLVELQRKFVALNFTVFAVNADRFLELETTDAQRTAYVEKADFTFPVAHLNAKMQEDYGNVNVYPTLFLVDSRGVIYEHFVGYQPLNVLEDNVAALLKEKRSASGRNLFKENRELACILGASIRTVQAKASRIHK